MCSCLPPLLTSFGGGFPLCELPIYWLPFIVLGVVFHVFGDHFADALTSPDLTSKLPGGRPSGGHRGGAGALGGAAAGPRLRQRGGDAAESGGQARGRS